MHRRLGSRSCLKELHFAYAPLVRKDANEKMIVLPVAGVLVMVALLATLAYVYYPATKPNQEEWIRDYEINLQQSMGIMCEIPELDPFSWEITKYDINLPDIRCPGQDWVKCYHSKCRVVDAIRDIITDIKCTFSDILYQGDNKYSIGPPTQLGGDDFYELKESDHVKVECVGTQKEGNWYTLKITSWSGNAVGFRTVQPPPTPPGRERTPNVVIFGFDSVSRNGFIRRMPKSWQMLKQIGATVMQRYNVVGGGTDDALLPILTGRTSWELPAAERLRKGASSPLNLDPDSFIFSKLKGDGYRTAFFEDRPDIGTFTYRFNGFARQPADHYLRALLMADWFDTFPLLYWMDQKKLSYCFGDTMQFKVMINLTQQFLELDGKRFIFTFIADITHDNFDLIRNADDDTAAFLHGLLTKAEDTLIVVMGDHGPRYSKARNTEQGRLEHRLPLLAIRLPDRLTRARPHAQRALEANARALTTPHDLHATILDVLDMRQHWNPHTVKGASNPRALSMLELIPRNRSCGEAGIEPHWCACLAWQNVSADDPMFHKPARALMEYINSLITTVGALCVPRTLNSTLWVLRQPDSLLARSGALDANKNYQVKIKAEPGGAMFEATMTYSVKEDKFTVDERDISRTNTYGHESACITNMNPNLNPYCYCRDADTAHQQHNQTGDKLN